MNIILNCIAIYGVGAVVMLLISIGLVFYDVKVKHIFYTRRKLVEDVLYMAAWSWIGVAVCVLIGGERLIRKLI